ncbi:hypothetical protein FQA39_LY14588 [Lamprigera yunnana]|nr:hypothetical protein FQA39_LY14588 [Lamprigera yunnana]
MAEALSNRGKGKSRVNYKNKRYDNSQYNLQKRAPHKDDTGSAVIYVSSKANVKALLGKCNKLIKNDEKEIVINCMGAAIQRGILLALQVCEQNPGYQVSPNTLTVELVGVYLCFIETG